MKIILAPAKNMYEIPGEVPHGIPVFAREASSILETLKDRSETELKKIWSCNDALVKQNLERLKTIDVSHGHLAAVEAYDGMVFRQFRDALKNAESRAYVEEHLRILSGLYGVLKPYDGIDPYRLEMQARLSVNGTKNLYAFWGDRLYHEVFSDGETVIDLASSEYSKALTPYLKAEDRMITVSFLELVQGKPVSRGTYAKMARGTMVRWMAEQKVREPEELRSFTECGYRYEESLSNEKEFIFIR